MNKLISIGLLAGGIAFGAMAQDQYVRQFHTDRQMVVGIASQSGGLPSGVTISGDTTVTNSLVSVTALGNGQTPPGEGLSWPVYGTQLATGSPTNDYLFVSTTGTGNQAGWSVKQLQGSPDNGMTWVNALVVSNAVPTATNTITTNIPIPVVNFAGYDRVRVFSVQNTTTNAGPAGSTNVISEYDQIKLYH